jgi:F0F1-type ATP synthase assembly protein I
MRSFLCKVTGLRDLSRRGDACRDVQLKESSGMRLVGLWACGYALIGLLVTMLMDRFKKLEPMVFIIGILVWPLVLPAAILSGLRDARRKR